MVAKPFNILIKSYPAIYYPFSELKKPYRRSYARKINILAQRFHKPVGRRINSIPIINNNYRQSSHDPNIHNLT
jgi:hypothetical protein